MLPTLFTYRSLGFHTWGLMIMLAFLASSMWVHMKAPKVGIDPDLLVPFYLVITLCGLLGARLLHFLMADTRLLIDHPGSFFDFTQGGFAFYGGAILGTLSGLAYAAVRRIPLWKLADAGAPAIMLGLAVGRWGCFFAGCCHGGRCPVGVSETLVSLPGGSVVTTTGFPWLALVFKRNVGVGAIWDVPVYPTPLWESAGAFALFLMLAWMWKRARRFDGQILATAMLTYPILRSTIEAYRGDTVRGVDWFGLLSTSQVVSLPVFALGLVVLALRARAGRAPETEFREEVDDVG
jgi:phosphatidylglycerol:prolipoprotein diacylglycerol transferase